MVKTGDQRAAAAAKRKGAPSPGGTGGGGGTMPELKSSVVDKDTTAASAAGAGAGGDKIEEMQAGLVDADRHTSTHGVSFPSQQLPRCFRPCNHSSHAISKSEGEHAYLSKIAQVEPPR